jgi:hypothetical protein
VTNVEGQTGEQAMARMKKKDTKRVVRKKEWTAP